MNHEDSFYESRLASQGAAPFPQGRELHGGVGKRGLPGASSSGQTITFLPSCHWSINILWATWTPSLSTLKRPKTVWRSILRMASLTFSPSSDPARLIPSSRIWQAPYPCAV